MIDNYTINLVLSKTDTSKVETVLNSLIIIKENFSRFKSNLIKNNLVEFLCSVYIEVF